MKNSINSIVLFVILFSFSILFVRCSNESSITSPNESNATTMAKTISTVTSSIDHSMDTVVTLPKSGKTLVVKKSTPTSQLALLDKYLSTHTISDKPTITISPMAGYYVDTLSYWELENQFSPASGKNLGISTNDISIYKAHNQYGFTSIIVNGTNDIDSAYKDGFSYDNLMLGLVNYNTAFSQIDASNSGGRHVGSYFIDEPIESGTWDDYTIESVASYVYPSKRIMLSSYKWPVSPQYWSYPVTYGQKYGPIVSSLGNIYIMCDEYYGNCFGHTYEYWNEFHGYYGTSKNIANWMQVVINNGNGNATSCGYAATSWGTLLLVANNLGISEVWLYASGTGDETAILNCCLASWQSGWLLRQEKYLVIVYQCSGLDCNWFNQTGTWTVKTAYYTTSQYISY